MSNRMSLSAITCFLAGMCFSMLLAVGIPTAVARAATVTVNCFGSLPQTLVDQFNKQNPGIKLVAKLPEEMSDETYQSAVRSGQYDLVIGLASPGYMDQWVQDGLLLSLNDYIQKDGISLKPFAGNLAEAMRLDNKIYDLPLSISPYFVVYNRDLFDRKGIEYPRDNWTWNDFRTMATRLKGSLSDSYGAVVPTEIWAVMAEQQSSRIYELALEKYASIVAFTQSMVNEKSLSIDLPQEINGGVMLIPNQGFLKGNIAMQVTQFPVRVQDFNIGIALLPAPEGQKATTPVTVETIGIPKAAKHATEAWRVIRYLATPQATQVLAANRRLPAAYLNPETLRLWATSRLNKAPNGYETLADIKPSIAGRRFEQLNNDFWYALENQAGEYFRGRRSEEAVLQTIRAELQAANAKAVRILSGK